MSLDRDAFKQGQRTMWAMGDYPQIARRIRSVGELLVERLGAGPGIELLDVATGAGNVSIPAARTGAKVSGLDLTPELLEVARRRAREADVKVDFVEGDAEALPFGDGSFDRVSSCFGVIFAPHHEQAARELLRVTRPGGMIAVTAWTPDGLIGRMFALNSSFMPPPPPEFQSPVKWGEEEHVRALLGTPGGELCIERREVVFEHDSAEAIVEEDERLLGPAMIAKAMLEPQGRYEEARSQLLELYGSVNESHDGRFRARAEYLLSIARLPA
ncbi:MAG TPA: methyltransferase domain-containing protein [Solirubrobacteraceae bacterium]